MLNSRVMKKRVIAILIALVILAFILRPRYPAPIVHTAVLSDDERAYILRQANKAFTTSTVAKTRKIDKSVRDSQTAWLSLTDPVVARVARRLLEHVNRPLANCEKLQVVKYGPGGHYKPHQDAFKERNKRLVTFILALTDDYDGGATHFPNLGKRFKLRAGDALQFACLNNYNLISRYGLHAGEPVKRGTKVIANLWVRKYAYES